MPNDLEKALATVVKSAGIIFVGLVIARLLGTVNQILLGRFLGVETYGLFTLAFSIVTIAATFAKFGLFTAVSRFIPFHLEKGEKGIVKSTIRFSLVLVLATSISIGLIMYIFSERISIDIFQENNLHVILKYFLFGLPLIATSEVLQGVLRGFKAVKYKAAIYDVGMITIKIAVFIPFIVIGYTLFGAVIAYFAGTIFCIFTATVIIRKKLFPDHSEYRMVPIAKKLLSFSWPLALTGMTFLFVTKTDILLIGYYLTSREVGIYTPAIIIAQLLTFVSVSFAYIFLPVVSELFAKEKIGVIKSLFKSAQKWIFLITLPMFVYILLFSKEIITLLFGFEYSEGYLVLVIIAVGLSMSIVAGMSGVILVAGGHTKLHLACEVITAITNVSLNVVLIPVYGIVGAAIGTGVSYFARNLASLAFVYKTNKTHPYTKDYIKIVLSGLIVLILFYLIKIQFFPFLTGAINLILVGLLLVGLYITLILLFHCLDKNDIFILKLITGRLGLDIKILDRL